MSEKKDVNIEAIAKIISLTRDGKLEWRSISPSTVSGEQLDQIISSVFITKYKNKILRLYHRKYKKASYDNISVAAAMGLQDLSTETRWYSEVVLELASAEGHSLWAFPKEEILNDLLTLIKYKVSGANDLIKSLLQE